MTSEQRDALFEVIRCMIAETKKHADCGDALALHKAHRVFDEVFAVAEDNVSAASIRNRRRAR